MRKSVLLTTDEWAVEKRSIKRQRIAIAKLPELRHQTVRWIKDSGAKLTHKLGVSLAHEQGRQIASEHVSLVLFKNRLAQ